MFLHRCCHPEKFGMFHLRRGPMSLSVGILLQVFYFICIFVFHKLLNKQNYFFLGWVVEMDLWATTVNIGIQS